MHASFGTTLCGRLKFVASWIMANSNDPCSTTMVPIGRGEINPGVGKLLCMCFLNAQAFTLGFQAGNTNASNISHLVKSYMLSSLPIIWMCTRLSYFLDVVRFEVNRTTFARSSWYVHMAFIKRRIEISFLIIWISWPFWSRSQIIDNCEHYHNIFCGWRMSCSQTLGFWVKFKVV